VCSPKNDLCWIDELWIIFETSKSQFSLFYTPMEKLEWDVQRLYVKCFKRWYTRWNYITGYHFLGDTLYINNNDKIKHGLVNFLQFLAATVYYFLIYDIHSKPAFFIPLKNPMPNYFWKLICKNGHSSPLGVNMPRSGSLWLAQGHYSSLRVIMAGSGSFWLIMAGSG